MPETLWPRVRSAVEPNDVLEAAVAEHLGRMSLEQKVGQMMQAEIAAITPEQVRQHHIGSVLNGGGSWPNQDRAASVQDWVDLADAFYDASGDIPVLWGTDAVHGHSNVRGATIFPHNIGLGAANDPELMHRIGVVTAREVAATGIDWTFAPTLAVVRDVRWGRTYESYAQHPDIVRAYAGRLVEGIQGSLGDGTVLACAKHFLGDGGTAGGVDQGDTQVSEEDLVAWHAQGYVTGLAAGAQTVMASFSSWNGQKMHGHRYLLTDVLRGPLGFDGFVVGDWNGHAQVPGSSNTDAAAAILAGVDMVMVPHDWEALLQTTLAQVREGVIPMARIDEAVTRILRVKMRAGLMGPFKNKGRPSSRPWAGRPLASAEHRAVAREAVRKSLVLLKDRGVLPLKKGAKVLVTGRGAHDIGLQSGGWTLTWQGTETSREDFPQATTIYEAFAQVCDATLGGPASPDFDAIVAVIGEAPYAEGVGDVTHVHHASHHPQDQALLDQLRQQAPGVPVVSVLLTGRPLDCNGELNRSDAFVVAWLPGGEGAGLTDVLFGDFPFTGCLSFAWPLGEGSLPCGYGLETGQRDALGVLPEQARRGRDSTPVFERGAFRGNFVLAPQGVRVETVDGRLQESARRLSWDGPGEVAFERDAAVEANTLVLELRGEGELTICGSAVTLSADWQEVRVPFVASAFVLRSAGATVAEFERITLE